MDVMKSTLFVGLLSLTMSSAIHGAGEPVVNQELDSQSTSSAAQSYKQQPARYVPIQYSYSSSMSHLNNVPATRIKGVPRAAKPQVVTSPKVATPRQPTVAQPQTAQTALPAARVAHLPVVTKPKTESLITLGPNESLAELLRKSRGTVLIDFYADWCGPCQRQSMILADMKDTARQLNASIIKVNIDQHRVLAERLSVESLPTILVVKDGLLLNRQSGIAGHDRVKAMLLLR